MTLSILAPGSPEPTGAKLASVFKIIEGDHTQIDSILERRGYEIATPTDLEILPLEKTNFTERDCLWFDEPDKDWLDFWTTFEKYNQ